METETKTCPIVIAMARDQIQPVGRHAVIARAHPTGGEHPLANACLAGVAHPTWIFAPVIVRDVVKACRDLADAGQTIVLVEQNLGAALTLAHRAYIINNGHIAHEGPTSDIRARPKVLLRLETASKPL